MLIPVGEKLFFQITNGKFGKDLEGNIEFHDFVPYLKGKELYALYYESQVNSLYYQFYIHEKLYTDYLKDLVTNGDIQK